MTADTLPVTDSKNPNFRSLADLNLCFIQPILENACSPLTNKLYIKKAVGH